MDDDTLHADDHAEGSNVLDEERQEIEKLSKLETKSVKRWRIGAILLVSLRTFITQTDRVKLSRLKQLIVAAALVTTLTFVFLRREEEEDFKTATNRVSQTISDSIHFHLAGVVDAMKGLSEVLSNEAQKDPTVRWPLMKLSSFEVFVQHTRFQTGSEFLVVCPIVQSSDLAAWNAYSIKNQDWIAEGFEVQEKKQTDLNPIPTSVYRFQNFKGKKVLSPESGDDLLPVAPFWQMSPPPFDTSIVNYNALSVAEYRQNYETMLQTRGIVIGRAQSNFLIDYAVSQTEHDVLHGIVPNSNRAGHADDHPHSSVTIPVFERLNDPSSSIVAILVGVLPWDVYLKKLLPVGVNGIFCVLKNSCHQEFTYVVNGQGVEYVGPSDTHDRAFDSFEFVISFDDILRTGTGGNGTSGCRYWISVYPSGALHDQYRSRTPIVFALVVASCFILMTVTFFVYDAQVVRKTKKIIDAAAKSGAVVSSLFPANVKEKILNEHTEKLGVCQSIPCEQKSSRNLGIEMFSRQKSSSTIMVEENSKPIADLFPETSIVFMDLVGFTSWSSAREPTDVFILLETLFAAFDKIAKRNDIYKVETIGDCWVGASGLPEPRDDHAVAVCRFATHCLLKLTKLTRQLEAMLGPETGDIKIRIGIHSGPVTAGVLRGERSRFQLFGDSMNTASRMESNGKPGCIQISEDTAHRLETAGLSSWIKPRVTRIHVKGKGSMQTYWLTTGMFSPQEGSFCRNPFHGEDNECGSADPNRLVLWVTTVLTDILSKFPPLDPRHSDTGYVPDPPLNALKETQDHISPLRGWTEVDPEEISNQIDPGVIEALQELVESLSGLCNENPFHNFSRTVHVAMAALKFLSRGKNHWRVSINNEAHSFCLASDPFVQFTCVFAALVHDLDHPGVPNSRLAVEEPSRARLYQNVAIAEQHSLSLAWNLFHEERFACLRSLVIPSQAAQSCFRSLLTNALATDITCTQMRSVQEDRFSLIFHESRSCPPEELAGRKLVVLLDLVMQASDISHTMQHWDTYIKWNKCLLRESYTAFKEGRADKDPTLQWLQSEKAFFDGHVIPLAQKLKLCESFGVSGNECLTYALENRRELDDCGEQVFHGIIREVLNESIDAIW